MTRVIEFATTYVVVCISAGSCSPTSPPASQLILSTTYGRVPTVTPVASQGRTLVMGRGPAGGATHPGHRPHATKRHIASSTMLPAAVAGSPRPR